MRVNLSCQPYEIYDPFRGKCVKVDFGFKPKEESPRASTTNTTEQAYCRGPNFRPNEFIVFENCSVYIIPHQKIYGNESYILMEDTLTLCVTTIFTTTRLFFSKHL